MTAWAWRMKVQRRLIDIGSVGHANPPSSAGDDAAVATTVLRESRKASREWVDHRRAPDRYPAPDRRRWIDYRLLRLPLPSPMTPHLLTVAVVESGNGRLHLRAPAPAAADLGAARAGAPTGRTPRAAFALPSPAALRAFAGRSRAPGLCHALERFLRPFRGPASRHLAGYVAWFVTRLATANDRRRVALERRLCREVPP